LTTCQVNRDTLASLLAKQLSLMISTYPTSKSKRCFAVMTHEAFARYVYFLSCSISPDIEHIH
jgi:hypothetical protein